ncbi:MAG: type II toxin-antitoxin system RelE/ParE family toxin [Chloroflexi bacterium]|nr:type II toxin-antitoxin system RelE/ParE family toxin [Chloroflexota bacterium]
MSILFTPTARRQFFEALAYIYHDSPSAAINFRERIEKALSRLHEHPESGRYLPEFPTLPYREVIVKPYRFFYRMKDKIVWIVAVWHGAQLPNEPTNTRSLQHPSQCTSWVQAECSSHLH